MGNCKYVFIFSKKKERKHLNMNHFSFNKASSNKTKSKSSRFYKHTFPHTLGKRNVLTSLSSFYKESTVIVNDNHLFYWHFPCSQMAGSPRKVYSPVTAVSHNIWYGKYRMWIKEPHIRHHIRSAYDLSCRTDTWKHSPVHNTRLLKQCSPTRSGE